MPGILDFDPQTQGLLQAAFAGLSASGPSRTPMSFGQVIGAAGSAGLKAADEQAKLQQALELQRMQIRRAKMDADLQEQLAPLISGGGILGASSGMSDPDVMEAIGQKLAVAGHPGGAALIGQAEKIRAKRAADAQVKAMQGAALPEAKSDVVGIAPDEEEALQRVKQATSEGKTATVKVAGGGEGLFGSLMNSEIPSIAAEARASQGILNSQKSTAIAPQHWLDLKKDLAAREARLLEQKAERERREASEPLVAVIKDGKPVMLPRSQASGLAPATQGAISDVIPPDHKDLHGDDYISTLPTGMGALVKSIAEGKVDPAKAASLRFGNREALMQRVQQYDPTYNQARSKVYADFTTGKAAQNVTAMNTVVAHMGTVSELTEALKNGNLQVANALVNRIRTETGKPEINNTEIAIQAMGNELMRVFRQVNASQHEVEAWQHKFNAAKGSPAQLKDALRVGGELLKGRLDAMRDQWDRGMGNAQRVEIGLPKIEFPLLSEKSKAALSRLGVVGSDIPLTPQSDAAAPTRTRKYNPSTGRVE